MSFQVTVQPSGQILSVEKNETILEAALRAGLALNYGCTNGSCGKCKAQVTAGQVHEIRFHDYVLGAAERQAGVHLLCCVTPQGNDVSIYAQQARIGEISTQSLTARVDKLERFGKDLAVLGLRTPRSQVLRFLPGQRVSVQRDGVGVRRLPIASCPCDGMHLRFHLRHQPGDAFSEWIFHQLRRTDTVHLEGPWGHFSLDEQSKRPIVFIAYDVGFGPTSSLIEHAINIDLAQPMHLYWYVVRLGEHYLDNQCRAWADALDVFSYVPLVVAPLGPTGVGMASATVPIGAAQAGSEIGQEIVRDHPDLSACDCYLIAPTAFREALKRTLLAHGLPRERLFEQDMDL